MFLCVCFVWLLSVCRSDFEGGFKGLLPWALFEKVEIVGVRGPKISKYRNEMGPINKQLPIKTN